MRKPESIVYWVNDRLPIPTALGLVLQQMAFLGALLVVPNLFLNETGFHLASSSFLDVAAASLIASALSILLQILNRWRSEEHTSELQSLMRSSYAVFCLKKKKYYIYSRKHTVSTELS